ncbi:MAG TPA: carboxypeptidase-like regulatory domain-containing protein [Candidatus Angelobacter sp.]|nr:carboxypeptidase-like regulatory domain-containing protein [Candidatus Angelobacter sp.]
MKPALLFSRRSTTQAFNPDDIRIASPCAADWNTMSGNDRVRHCAECNLKVYNFSAMTQPEIQRLIASTQGRLCARFYHRSDGTLLTQDCPRGISAAVRRISRAATAVMAAVMSTSFTWAGAKPQAQDTPQKTKNYCQKPGIDLIVFDPQGAVIPNAEVALANKAGKIKRRGKTNAAGKLLFSGVDDGKYVITVNSPGFATVSDLVTVEEARLLELQLKLPVAGTRIEISVQASQVWVQGTTVGVLASRDSSGFPPAGISSGRPQPLRR